MGTQTVQVVCETGMSFTLPRGTAMRLKRAAGARIVCRGGTLWMSQYRPGEDRVLAAGQSVRVDGDHDVVLSGLPQAQVELLDATGDRR